jgi:RNA polymerase sigma factor (sigma-70 family)
MAASVLTSVMRYLSRSPTSPARDLSDVQLLERFRLRGDEAAFTILMQRHGPMVLGVCRRVLGRASDADDAFQATFLVLLRKASSIRRSVSPGCWLYGVAWRVAVKARDRRRPFAPYEDEFAARDGDPAELVARREWTALLDEEIAGLPAKYRSPLVLCALEGKTCEQAARELGWPKSTLGLRLSRARELLRGRLARRGVTVPAALLAAGLARETSAACLSASLTLDTVRLVRQAAGGRPGLGAAASLAAQATKGTAAGRLVVCGLTAALGIAAVVACSAAVSTGALPDPPPAEAPATPKPAVRTDHEGVPLPAEALARVGSSRMRHGRVLRSVSFSPDGTLLSSSGLGVVRVWQAATGKLVWQASLADGGRVPDGFFSADGKTVVAVDGQTCRWLDARTGREVESCDSKIPKELHFARLAPHGEMIGVFSQLRGGDLVVYDLPSGRERFRKKADGQWDRDSAFSADGRMVATLEYLGGRAIQPARVRLFDTFTGQVLGKFDPGVVCRGAAFAPDGKKLVLHDREKRFVVRNVPDGKVLHTADVAVVHVYVVAFAPDSASVVVGSGDLDDVQIELSTGKELQRYRTYPTTTSLAFSPDGKGLVVGTFDGSISQWDLVTGRRLAASVDRVRVPGPLRFTEGGRILRVWDDALTTLDWRSRREIKRVPIPQQGGSWDLAVSPEGSRIAGTISAGKLGVWDTASGDELRMIDTPLVSQLGGRPAFSPDGKTLYISEQKGPLHAVDVATGRELPAFDKKERQTHLLVVSPDGRQLATTEHPGDRREITVLDPATGREIHHLLPRPDKVRTTAMTFSPDGRYLAAVGGEAGMVTGKGDGFIALWDVRNGDEKFAVTGLTDGLLCMAYSTDGRLLATGGADGTVRLWEVATGKERHRFAGHDGWVYGIALSPEGRFVAASSPDAPIFVWDVEGTEGKLPSQTPFSAGDKADLWKALDGADAAAAFAAMRQLLGRPGRAVALLRERLRPAAEVDDKDIQRLLRDLDSDAFAEREKAAADLRAVADRAEAALRKALQDNPSAEARRRIEAVLESAGPAAAERRREVRSVEVLERIGTAEARELLTSLAGGAKYALLTREARAAVGRLKFGR